MPTDLAKVMIAVPTRGLVDFNTITRLQLIRDNEPLLKPILYVAGRLSVSDVRNRIVMAFLDSGLEYLIMIDDDVVPHTKLLNILQHDVDIVGAPYFISRAEVNMPFPSVFTKKEGQSGYVPFEKPFEYLGRPALVKVDAVATGCIAIKRAVLSHSDMKAPFNMNYDSHGRYIASDDMAFCSRATQAGFEIYCDFGIPADHMLQGISMNMLHTQYTSVFDKLQKAKDEKSRIILP